MVTPELHGPLRKEQQIWWKRKNLLRDLGKIQPSRGGKMGGWRSGASFPLVQLLQKSTVPNCTLEIYDAHAWLNLHIKRCMVELHIVHRRWKSWTESSGKLVIRVVGDLEEKRSATVSLLQVSSTWQRYHIYTHGTSWVRMLGWGCTVCVNDRHC